ncbi:class I SAM-dependent methyltransferase [Sphaerisporangium sp. NPDC049003]|uniref:class I SAM-dependent methyltransferase n=1 Tax=Sphaerisporangium sp. NPDC049003 TaxID=3364517 RepID=UPI00371EC24A
MADDAAPVPAWQAMTEVQVRRWETVLGGIAEMLPPGPVCVVVDGAGPRSAALADRLASTLHAAGRPSVRLSDTSPPADEDAWYAGRTFGTVAIADGRRWRTHPPQDRWDVTIWLRTRATGGRSEENAESGADIVVDVHDPAWPVIRHVTAALADHNRWYVTESRAFFGPRAATWDTKFGDDMPAYAAAIKEAGLPRDGVVVDVGCGTGRALLALREAVGPGGGVIALDLSPEMLGQARAQGRAEHARLVIGDARRLPVADASIGAVFAAGLIMHLPDPDAGLRELARATRPGGLLILFHPSGRAALAARHGRTLSPDEPLAEERLRRSMHQTGWKLTTYDDPSHRFLAIATRH